MGSCSSGDSGVRARVRGRRSRVRWLAALASCGGLLTAPLHGGDGEPSGHGGDGAAELPPDAPATAEPATADALSQAAVQEAFRLLRGRYLYRDELDFDRLNRLSLAGVLEGLGAGAELVTDESVEGAAEPPPLLVADLTGGAVYLRPGPVADDEGDEGPATVRGRLREWDGRRPWLILDLRGPVGGGGGPDLALDWLELFTGPNEILFKRTHPEGGRPLLFVTEAPAVWTGGVIVLVSGDTDMAGELMAAVLGRQGAILAGEPTGGRTVDYEEVPVAQGLRLRFATSEVLLADGGSLFDVGLEPDWVIAEEPQARRQRLEAAADAGAVAGWFMERARPRMNERALGDGGQPELDWRMARAAGEPHEADRPPRHDPVLRAVLDALVAARAMAGAGG